MLEDIHTCESEGVCWAIAAAGLDAAEKVIVLWRNSIEEKQVSVCRGERIDWRRGAGRLNTAVVAKEQDLAHT